MLQLIIHHNVCLSRHQRYALHAGEDIKIVGVSVPVWQHDKLTSEPAKEVFCNYYLKNPKTEVPAKILEDGYEISIPYREGIGLNITNEEWFELLKHNPNKLDAMYQQTIQEISSKNLLDLKDGGCGFLNYRESNKIKREKDYLSIVHYVCLSSLEELALFESHSDSHGDRSANF